MEKTEVAFRGLLCCPSCCSIARSQNLCMHDGDPCALARLLRMAHARLCRRRQEPTANHAPACGLRPPAPMPHTPGGCRELPKTPLWTSQASQPLKQATALPTPSALWNTSEHGWVAECAGRGVARARERCCSATLDARAPAVSATPKLGISPSRHTPATCRACRAVLGRARMLCVLCRVVLPRAGLCWAVPCPLLRTRSRVGSASGPPSITAHPLPHRCPRRDPPGTHLQSCISARHATFPEWHKHARVLPRQGTSWAEWRSKREASRPTRKVGAETPTAAGNVSRRPGSAASRVGVRNGRMDPHAPRVHSPVIRGSVCLMLGSRCLVLSGARARHWRTLARRHALAMHARYHRTALARMPMLACLSLDIKVAASCYLS